MSLIPTLFLAIAVIILAVPLIRPYGWICVLLAVLAIIAAATGGGIGFHIGR